MKYQYIAPPQTMKYDTYFTKTRNTTALSSLSLRIFNFSKQSLLNKTL